METRERRRLEEERRKEKKRGIGMETQTAATRAEEDKQWQQQRADLRDGAAPAREAAAAASLGAWLSLPGRRDALVWKERERRERHRKSGKNSADLPHQMHCFSPFFPKPIRLFLLALLCTRERERL
jgi:hypothetical protein